MWLSKQEGGAKMKNVVIVVVTTCALISPQFILQSYPSFANFLGMSVAVAINLVFSLKV